MGLEWLDEVEEEDIAASAGDPLAYLDEPETVAPPSAGVDNLAYLDAAEPHPESPDVPDFNNARNFASRISDITGGFIGVATDIADLADPIVDWVESYTGGLVWEEGDYLPTYLNGEAYTKFKEIQGENSGFFDTLEVGLKDFDAGYIPDHTWQTVEDEFSKGGLSISAMGETLAYGLETGVGSIADMVGMALNFPGYVIARSGETGDIRAKNSGRDEGDLVDTLEALPFMIGSSLFDRYGMNAMFKNMSKEGLEQIGKEVIEHGFAKVAAKKAGEAAFVESGTEFFQEGVIEYIGEKFGTDAAMDWREAVNRGLGGAVAGGVMGGAVGGAKVGAAKVLYPRRGDSLDQKTQEVVGEDQGEEAGDMLSQMVEATIAAAQKVKGQKSKDALSTAAEYLDTVNQPHIDALKADEVAEMEAQSDRINAEADAVEAEAADETLIAHRVYEYAIDSNLDIADDFADDADIIAAVKEAAEVFEVEFVDDAALLEDFYNFTKGEEAVASIVPKKAKPVEEEADPFDLGDVDLEPPADVDSAIKLEDPDYKAVMQQMADEIQTGKDAVALIPKGDSESAFTRSQSTNAQWKKDLANDPGTRGLSAEKIKNALQKAIDGKPLRERQKRIVEAALADIDDQRPEFLQRLQADEAIDRALAAEPKTAEPDSDYLTDEEIDAEVPAIVSEGGGAFKTAKFAQKARYDQGLQDTHEVIVYGTGYGIVPNAQAEGIAESNVENLPEGVSKAQKAREQETATTIAFDQAAEKTDPTGKTGAKGVAKIGGMSIALENPKGTERKGTDPDGKNWAITMQDDYGEIQNTKGADGDPVDAFVGTNYDSQRVFVVDQVNPKTGKFDEHKVVLGTQLQAQAEEVYNRNYEAGWKGMGNITEMSMKQFKRWVMNPENTKKPAAKPSAMELKKQESLRPRWKVIQKFGDVMIDHETELEDGTIKRVRMKANTVWKNTQKRRQGIDSLMRCLRGS